LKSIEKNDSKFSSNNDFECFIFQDQIAVLPEVNEKIQERIQLWSKGEIPVKWACVLTGEVKMDKEALIQVVDNFFELPAYTLSQEHGLAFCLDDIKRISEDHYIIAMLQLHPANDLFPSSSDLAIAIYTDLLLSRPILHIFANPKGDKLILTFKKCHECEHSFFKLFQYNERR
jgi:hypothetical protein